MPITQTMEQMKQKYLRRRHYLKPGEEDQGAEKHRSQNGTEITISYNKSKHLQNAYYSPRIFLSTLTH